jgi:DNA-binding transcriptional regulator YiaG
MTPAELNRLLDRLGISQVDAARIIGITDRTMRNYVSGDTNIPEPTAKLLRLVQTQKLNLQQVEKA